MSTRSATPAAGRRPVARFVLRFGALLFLLLGITHLEAVEQGLVEPHLAWSARVGSAGLNLLGLSTSVDGRLISSSGFAIEVRRGCDAVEPACLLVAALLAFPAPLVAKLLGALVGVTLLVGLNLLRIQSLFWIGLRFPQAFDAAHVEVGQALVIGITGSVFLGWVLLVARRPVREAAHVPG